MRRSSRSHTSDVCDIFVFVPDLATDVDGRFDRPGTSHDNHASTIYIEDGEALEHVDEFCERLGGYVDLKDAQRMWYGSTQGIGNGGKGNGEWPVDNKYLQLWAVPYDGHQRILNDFQSRPGSGA